MKVYLKKSKIHGNGIFALENINEREVIELCPTIILNKKDKEIIDKTFLYDYYFSWKNNGCAIALGYGSMYNHSYEPNAKYKRNFSNQTITFVAIKPIKKREEITVNYNGDPINQEKVWFEKIKIS